MLTTTRRVAASLCVFVSLSLLLLGSNSLVAADDMWEGVFAYQKKMADYGNAEAQYKLGEMFEEGHGTDQDFDKAKEWYQKAAAQGYAQATKRIEQLETRKQRAIAEARAAEEHKRAEQARLEREKAEQLQAEQERIAREKAAQEEAERVAREKAEKELQAKQQKEDKQRQAEEERLARERAEAAIKAMMAEPSGYGD